MDEANLTTVNLLRRQARAEHEELHQLLTEVRNQFGACTQHTDPAKGRCFAEAARQLRQHIDSHFAHEASGGWLEEAVVRAPHLAHRLTRLEHEHEPLRKQAAHLVKMAEALDRTSDPPDALHKEFDRFAKRLLKHEADEEQVLSEGFNEDLDLR
jgi:hypothetical protein